MKMSRKNILIVVVVFSVIIGSLLMGYFLKMFTGENNSEKIVDPTLNGRVPLNVIKRSARYFYGIFFSKYSSVEYDEDISEAGKTREIEFKYYDQFAKRVQITGEFNDWATENMKENNVSEWVINKSLRSDIEYSYQLIVNGKTIRDPKNQNVSIIRSDEECSVVPRGITYIYSKNILSDNSAFVKNISNANIEEQNTIEELKEETMAIPKEVLLNGKVVDVRERGMANVIVKISQNSEEILRVVTDSHGEFVTPAMPFGQYEIKVWKETFLPIELLVNLDSEYKKVMQIVLTRH